MNLLVKKLASRSDPGLAIGVLLNVCRYDESSDIVTGGGHERPQLMSVSEDMMLQIRAKKKNSAATEMLLRSTRVMCDVSCMVFTGVSMSSKRNLGRLWRR